MTNARYLKNLATYPEVQNFKTDKLFVGEILMEVGVSLKEECLAHFNASQVWKSAAHIGVYMSPKEIETQEKWERILISLGF